MAYVNFRKCNLLKLIVKERHNINRLPQGEKIVKVLRDTVPQKHHVHVDRRTSSNL